MPQTPRILIVDDDPVVADSLAEFLGQEGYATATDLADYLVKKGVPFRDAHDIVGRAVKMAIDAGCDLSDLSLKQLKSICARINDDVFAVLTLEGAVAARDHFGGTAPAQVKAAIARARAKLGA